MGNVSNLKKICSLYISDWHLTVMILPYIKNELENKRKIITFLEQGIEENVSLLISKLNLEEKMEEKIKSINWNETRILKYSEIEKELKSEKQEISILVNGKKDYIDKVNMNIEKYIANNKNQKIKIINCYETSGFNNNIKEILDNHDKMLNTAGEKEISEVLDEYKNKIAE